MPSSRPLLRISPGGFFSPSSAWVISLAFGAWPFWIASDSSWKVATDVLLRGGLHVAPPYAAWRRFGCVDVENMLPWENIMSEEIDTCQEDGRRSTASGAREAHSAWAPARKISWLSRRTSSTRRGC